MKKLENAQTLVAVEKERERESYSLVDSVSGKLWPFNFKYININIFLSS